MVKKLLQKLVTKSELARVAAVSPAAVSKSIKTKLKPAIVGKLIDLNHPIVKKYIEKQHHIKTGPAQGIDPLYQDAVDHCQLVKKFNASIVMRKLSIGYVRAERIFKMMQAAGTDKYIPPPPPPPTLREIKNKRPKNKNKSIESGTMLHDIPDDIKAFADMTLRELIHRFGTDIAFVDWLKATKSIEDINEKRLKNAVTQGELVSRKLIKTSIIDRVNTVHQMLLTDGADTINKRVRIMTKAGRSEKQTKDFVIDQISSFIKPMKVKIIKALKNA